MSFLQKTGHKHVYGEPQTEKVLLAKYRSEDGETKYINTTGYDLITFRLCSCKHREVVDLKRVKV